MYVYMTNKNIEIERMYLKVKIDGSFSIPFKVGDRKGSVYINQYVGSVPSTFQLQSRKLT